MIASQPYRARASLDFKAKRVIAPLSRALGPGGRLIAIHSHGNDPGHEIVQKVWPGENPFIHDRHQIMKAVKQELGPAGRDLNFNAYADNRSLFRYDMHTLPSEITQESSIGTSTLFAAWNAAIYVAQVEDHRVAEAAADGTLSRGDQRGPAEARRAVVLRRVLRDLAPARVDGKAIGRGDPCGTPDTALAGAAFGRCLALPPALCNDRGREEQKPWPSMAVVSVGRLTRLGCCACAFLAALALATTAASAQTYGFATLPAGSLSHVIASAISKAMKERAGLNVLVQPAAGGNVIVPLVARGEAEVGLVNIMEAQDGLDGGLKDLRLIGAAPGAAHAVLRPQGLRTCSRSRISRASA